VAEKKLVEPIVPEALEDEKTSSTPNSAPASVSSQPKRTPPGVDQKIKSQITTPQQPSSSSSTPAASSSALAVVASNQAQKSAWGNKSSAPGGPSPQGVWGNKTTPQPQIQTGTSKSQPLLQNETEEKETEEKQTQKAEKEKKKEKKQSRSS